MEAVLDWRPFWLFDNHLYAENIVLLLKREMNVSVTVCVDLEYGVLFFLIPFKCDKAIHIESYPVGAKITYKYLFVSWNNWVVAEKWLQTKLMTLST